MLIRIILIVFLISSVLPVQAQNNVTWINILQLKLAFDANTSQPMQWSPDGQKIIAYMLDETIERNSSRMRVYEVGTGNVLLDTAASEASWQWHPNSELIAIWYSGAPAIEIWSLAAQQPIAILQGHTDAILQADWSPDGAYLATYSQDKTLRVWDSSGKSIGMLSGINNMPYEGFSWSPTSDALAFKGKVWRVFDNAIITYSTDSHTMAWSPDGKYIAVVHNFGELHIWNVLTDERVKIISAEKITLRRVEWSPDGTLISTEYVNTDPFEGYVKLLDFSGKEIKVFAMPDERYSYFYGWDKTANYSIMADFYHLYFWDAYGQELLLQIEFEEMTTVTSLTYDGRYFAETPVDPFSENRYHEVHIWDIELEQQVSTLYQHQQIITYLEWSPDGNYLASSDYDGNLIIWQKTVGVG